MTMYSTGQLLNNIGATPGVSARSSQVRIPFLFTSHRRLVLAGKAKPDDILPLVGATLISKSSEDSRVQSVKEILMSQYESAVSAIRDVSATYDSVIAGNGLPDNPEPPDNPYIEMMINPYSIQLVTPKRINKRDTRRGSIFYHFSDNAGRNNDITVINFSGQTGYINLKSVMDSNGSNTAVENLSAFHRLAGLTNEPMQYVDPQTKKVYPNIMYITMFTKGFPTGITFIGHFTTSLEWNESAQAQPNMIEYRMAFAVTTSVPDYGKDMEDIIVNELRTLTETSSASLAASAITDSLVGGEV